MSLRVKFTAMRIMKVITTYDYSSALNLSEKYQKVYASVRSYLCTCKNHILIQKWISMKCPHKSHVEGDRNDKFLSLLQFTTATNFEIPRLTQMYTFPGQMNWQFVLKIASNLPSRASFHHLFILM